MMKVPFHGLAPRLLVAIAAAAALPGALLLCLSSQASADQPPGAPAALTSPTSQSPLPSPTGKYERVSLGLARMKGIVLQENAGSTGYSWQFSVGWSRFAPGSSVTPPVPSPTSTAPWEHEVVLLDGTTFIDNPVPGVGRSGLRVLALTGAQRGEAWVMAQLRRPWEDAPIQTRNFLVTVM